MHTRNLFGFRHRSLVFGLALGLSVPVLANAQQPSSEPKLDLTPSLPSLTQFVKDSNDTPQYSSSQVASVDTDKMDFSSSLKDADQPPPRRQYGRPRYSDRGHNADGSNRYAFMAVGGFVSPGGATSNYQTLGWKIAVGGGINFDKTFGILLQYDYDHMGIPGYILNNMINTYANAGYDASGLDGNTHVWSLTLSPIITFMQNESSAAYVVGGAGFYRKVTNFTLPSVGYYCDYYGFCYQYTSNQTFDHYSNNAGGLDIGLGFAHKLSRYSNEKIFAEARYTWVNNSQNANSFYIPNGYRTSYIPVTVGLRW